MIEVVSNKVSWRFGADWLPACAPESDWVMSASP
jgi:hypothetical protein